MIDALLSAPIVTLFVILAAGIVVGKLSIYGFSLGISAIILVAVFFGHLGYSVPPFLQELGLILFIYSIGVQAGPGFLGTLKSKGQPLALLALVSLGGAAAAAFFLGNYFGIDKNLTAGIFTGAITSAPGLAVAIESSQSPLVSIGYTITYPAGILLVILLTKLAPVILKVNIGKEEAAYLLEQHKDYPEILSRHFVVTNPNVQGQTIGSLAVRTMTGCNISRIMSGGLAQTPTSGTVLIGGDIIKAVGTEESLRKMQMLIGAPTSTEIPLTSSYDVRKILVSDKRTVNMRLDELGIFEKHNATAARIRRSGIDITPTSHTRIKLGDVITVSAPSEEMPHVSKLFGDSRKKLEEFDVLPIALTILLGILVGQIHIPFMGMSFGLGLTGGVLIASLFLSYIGRTGPIVWNVSGNTNQFLRKLGLMLFLAAVGTNAGGSFAGTFLIYGWQVIFTGIAVTVTPILLCLIIGSFMLKLNMLTLLGGLAGCMTSTPALSAIESVSETDAVQSAYATVYPIALVIMIVLSQALAVLAQQV
jgi:putative transport protein